MNGGDWLTTTQAAKRVGVHPQTLKTYADLGLIDYRQVGRRGHRRFLRSELDRFVAEAMAQRSQGGT